MDPHETTDGRALRVDGSRIWISDIVGHIAQFLPKNEVSCTIRLVNKQAADLFRHRATVRLSLPSPNFAFKHKWGARNAMRWMTLTQRLRLLELTAGTGDVANLQIAIGNAGCVLPASALEVAAAAGHLAACQLLQQHGCPVTESQLNVAAQGGHRPVCEWLLEVGCPWSWLAVCAAACGGHVDLMEWLLRQDSHNTIFGDQALADTLFTAVVSGCDLATMQRMGNTFQGAIHRQSQVFSEAAAGSKAADWRLRLLWLEEERFPTGVSWHGAASRTDALERLAWLRQQRGCRFSLVTANAAAEAGNLEALRYLAEDQGVEVDTSTVMAAVAGGHVAVLQYLLDRVEVLDVSKCCGPQASEAVKKGHLPTLKLLFSHVRCNTWEPLLRLALLSGQLSVAKWFLRKVGLPCLTWHTGFSDLCEALLSNPAASELAPWLRRRRVGLDAAVAFRCAANSGSERAVTQLVKDGVEMEPSGYLLAVRNGDLAMLRCLRRLGCPWGAPNSVLLYCFHGPCSLAALQELVRLGCPVNWAEAMTQAPLLQQYDLGWLTEQQVVQKENCHTEVAEEEEQQQQQQQQGLRGLEDCCGALDSVDGAAGVDGRGGSGGASGCDRDTDEGVSDSDSEVSSCWTWQQEETGAGDGARSGGEGEGSGSGASFESTSVETTDKEEQRSLQLTSEDTA